MHFSFFQNEKVFSWRRKKASMKSFFSFFECKESMLYLPFKAIFLGALSVNIAHTLNLKPLFKLSQRNLGAFRNKAKRVVTPINTEIIRNSLSNTRAALIHSFWFFNICGESSESFVLWKRSKRIDVAPMDEPLFSGLWWWVQQWSLEVFLRVLFW